MIQNWYPIFALVLLQSLGLSLILTPLARRLALRLDILDHPGERKLQVVPVPLLGGAAIFAAFSGTMLIDLGFLYASGRLGFEWIETNVLSFLGGDSMMRLLGLSLGGLAIFILGVLDDLGALTPERKLVGQAFAAGIPVLFGIRLDLFIDVTLQFLSVHEHLSPVLYEALRVTISGAATIFWLVAIINATNFIDNMDGLCAGVCLIAACSFFLCVLPQQEYFVAITLLVFAGSVAGFLFHNLHPARIFMGDAGSLFCGYLLGVLAVLSTFYAEGSVSRVAVVAPLFALAIPLFDMMAVVWSRIRRGESIMKGDKRHFSHQLVEAGMSQDRAVDFILLVAVVTGLGAALLGRVGTLGTFVIFAQTAGVFALIIVLMSPRRSNGPRS